VKRRKERESTDYADLEKQKRGDKKKKKKKEEGTTKFAKLREIWKKGGKEGKNKENYGIRVITLNN
jgi:hypothetical protein